MLPLSTSFQHWVLLEFDNPVLPPEGSRRAFPEDDDGQAPTTVYAFKPRRLTCAEREALHIVFPAQLRWPPTDRAEPMLLKQAAARLGISVSAVQDRLKSALVRAVALGQDRIVSLTDPFYLYVLARAGYLALPTQFPHRRPKLQRSTMHRQAHSALA